MRARRIPAEALVMGVIWGGYLLAVVIGLIVLPKHATAGDQCVLFECIAPASMFLALAVLAAPVLAVLSLVAPLVVSRARRRGAAADLPPSTDSAARR